MKLSTRPLLPLVAGVVLATVATTLVGAQDWAKTRLEASPRHHEYISLKAGNRTVDAFVVYPEIKTKAPVVILIHEIFGLSNWAKEMADELAAQGFIVVAPDLLSGMGPNGGGSSEFPNQDASVKAVSGLDPDGVMAALDAAADYGKKIPAANGTLAVVGFCWGGGKSFAFAAHRHDLSAAFVFYGTGPADVSTVTAPVYGFYAGNDMRIGATLPATTEAMKAAGKKYDPVTYDGAGHGFMRAGEDPGADDVIKNNPCAAASAPTPCDVPPAVKQATANKIARAQGFARLVKLLHEMQSAPRASTGAIKPVSARNPAPAAACHETADTTAM